jgi:hypothetical protein
VFYACRLFSLLYYVVCCVVCCGGLLGAVVVVFVVCLAWAVGVFDVPPRVPPLVVGGWGQSFYIGGFVCLWSLWRLGGVLWSF